MPGSELPRPVHSHLSHITWLSRNPASVPLLATSTVNWFNLIELFSLCKVVNWSISAVDRFAASQFINMLLNSRSSYLDSMIETKMKSNDSLMKILMMFFEINRCSNVLSASKLVIKTNSTLLIESNDVKNSSIDSNSINLASSIIDEIELNSSKYWIAFSLFESLIMFLKLTIYCFKQRSYSERNLYSEWWLKNVFTNFFVSFRSD